MQNIFPWSDNTSHEVEVKDLTVDNDENKQEFEDKQEIDNKQENEDKQEIESITEANTEITTEETINVKVGDEITLGKYPQNNDETLQPIEWQVLDVTDDKALIISKYCLDSRLYNEQDVDVTWETCTLRTWLNQDFLENAFSSEEINYILETHLINDDNPVWGTDGGNDTDDKIFLLSIDEAMNYFNLTEDPDEESHTARMLYGYGDACQCKATEYAISQVTYNLDSDDYASWWLRSIGSHGDNAAVISGSALYAGTENIGVMVYVSRDKNCIRPALWINLDALSSSNISENEEQAAEDNSESDSNIINEPYWVTSDFGTNYLIPAGFVDDRPNESWSNYHTFNNDELNMTISIGEMSEDKVGDLKHSQENLRYEYTNELGYTIEYDTDFYNDSKILGFVLSGHNDDGTKIYYYKQKILDSELYEVIKFYYPIENKEKCDQILTDFLDNAQYR